MVYFLFSEGFRLGGYNSPKAAATGTIPLIYNPDLLKNYELGLKSQWLDNRLLINVTLFDMQWSDIQINSRVGDSPWWLRGTWNGETGESIGAEMDFEWQATGNLSFQGSAYFADSKYTADSYDPRGNLYLEDGQEMPNSPKVKYWLAVEYTIPGVEILNGDLWFRYDTSYQGKIWDNLDAAIDNDPEGIIPAWHSSNLQIGLNMQNEWDVTLMARNIWNDHGYNSLYNTTYASDWFGDPRWRNERTLQRPRTVTLSVRKRF
jgi:outer membrane receptor protein involved in Fe transport